MNIPLPARTDRAFTRNELVVVICIIGLMLAIGVPLHIRDANHWRHVADRARRFACVNNLKQIGQAARSWAVDHHDSYPETVSTTQGGGSEDVGSPADTWKIFGCMSNELNTPKILYCPADRDTPRSQANYFTNAIVPLQPFTYGDNTNLSYFVGADANELYPGMFLAGDHNLGDGDASAPDQGASTDYSMTASTSLQAPGANLASLKIAWTDGVHIDQGNVLFADNSVQQCTISSLRHYLSNSGDPGRTNTITGKWPGDPAHLNRLQFPSLP